MNKIICQKCGYEISNEFSITLSFCTNCGAAINNLSADETVKLKKETFADEEPKNKLFPGLVLGVILSAFVFGIGYLLLNYFSSNQSEMSSGETEPSAKSSPWIKLPSFNSVAASEITKVAFSVNSHAGPLVGSDESYTTSSATSFSNDGIALKSSGVKNYDTGKKKGSEGQKYQGIVSKEQFEKLAATLAESDFSDIQNSTKIITDTTTYTLIISYSGKIKTIVTSNTGEDTAEIKTILQAFENLKNEIEWKEIK